MEHEIHAVSTAGTLAGIFVLGLLGCGAEPSTADAPDGVATRVTEDDGGDSAVLRGQVAELDGCFYIEDGKSAGDLWVAVFPADMVDASPTGDGFELNGEDYTDGDEISVGGSATVGVTYPVPAECDEDIPQWQVHPEG